MTETNAKRTVLSQRAEKLSSKINPEVDQDYLQVVVFYLDHETYAIESLYIREVLALKELTEIPHLPSFVKGVTHVRRKILSVIDLKEFLGISNGSKRIDQKTLILEHQAREFAILTDGIEGVRSIPLQTIQGSLPTLTGVRQEFLKGLTIDRLIILDGKRLLENQRLIIQEVV
jgi:purine-binding chemotaxis protein CheW